MAGGATRVLVRVAQVLRAPEPRIAAIRLTLDRVRPKADPVNPPSYFFARICALRTCKNVISRAAKLTCLGRAAGINPAARYGCITCVRFEAYRPSLLLLQPLPVNDLPV